ncbi:hypothetical protein ACFL2D_03265 [Patescibacteria group bacterium]
MMYGKKDILAMTNPAEVTKLYAGNVAHFLDQDEFVHIAKLLNAFWQHDGDMSKPHVELTNGAHSNGFINTLEVLSYSNLLHLFTLRLLEVVRELRIDLGFNKKIDWVVGSDHAAAALAVHTAFLLGARCDFTEKGPNKTQLWKRFTIGPEETVLHVEELITTFGTYEAVRTGIHDAHPHKINFIPLTALVDRTLDGPIQSRHQMASVYRFEMRNWPPEECPLCKEGSVAIRKPKLNWAQLTG